jgi:hypothetical protein
MSGAPPVTNVGPTNEISPEGWNRFFDLLNCTGDAQVACAQGVATNDVIAAYTQLLPSSLEGEFAFVANDPR